MERTYNYAGISKLNGKYKVRFSDRASYVKNLQVAGNTDIDLIELKEPMNKIDAVKYLLAINFDNGNQQIRKALEDNLETRYDRARAKVAIADDPIACMREIRDRLRELNELVARMTNLSDDMDDDTPVAQPAGIDPDEDEPF